MKKNLCVNWTIKILNLKKIIAILKKKIRNNKYLQIISKIFEDLYEQ